MEIKTIHKKSFSVIGIQTTSKDGSGFEGKAWTSANTRMDDLKGKAKIDARGLVVGVWGLRSLDSKKLTPFTGEKDYFYIAGLEVKDDAVAPKGWVRWNVPDSDYVYVKYEPEESKASAIASAEEYISDHKLTRTGSYYEYMHFNMALKKPESYIMFPIENENPQFTFKVLK